MAQGEGKKVCVTGASGFIASWIVKLLLDRGYEVNGTVLHLNDPKEVDHLMALEGAKEKLHLFEANLLAEGSFDSAIQGCDGVFHTAFPVKLDVSDPQAELIDPAVNGALNVLLSCAKVPTIKRVVVTSSMAAVLIAGKPLTAETVVDETWFSDPEIIQKIEHPLKWYAMSKTLAEKAAWKFVEEHNIDMIILNPAYVIGPLLQPTCNSSSMTVLNLINGSETYDDELYGLVNVKDVAKAHILAFENPSAKGRYLLNESVVHLSEAVEMLREIYPNIKLASKSSKECSDPTYKVSTKYAERLGIKYTPLKVTLQETVDCFIEKKFVTI